MTKISVIIPVYNTEKYLEKCLDSVINQTCEDLEIICIDDGSKDNSLDILNAYAKKDKRIIVLHQKNQGVGIARNIGIDKAKGDFIMFVDSDDWWEVDLAEKILKEIENSKADIIQFGHNYLKDGEFPPSEIIDKIKEVTEGKNYTEYFNDFVNFVWDKAYKTSFIKDNKIKFPMNIHPTEDVLFVLECFSHKPKIAFMPECLYDYRTNREGSVMKKYDNLVPNQIKSLYILFNSDFYKNSDNRYKIMCIKKLLGGIIYFCILGISKNCPMKAYVSELQELVCYIKKEIPSEIIQTCNEIGIVERFAAIKN